MEVLGLSQASKELRFLVWFPLVSLLCWGLGVLSFICIEKPCIEAGRREFDLLADEAFYKVQLAPQSRPLVQVRAARRSLIERIRCTGKRCLSGLRALRPRRPDR